MRSVAGARVGDDHRDGGILAGPAVMEGLVCDDHGRRYLLGANYSYDDRLVVQDDGRENVDARCHWSEESMRESWDQNRGILVGSSRIYYHYQHVVGLGSLRFEDGVHRRRCCFRAAGDDWLHRRMATAAVRHRHEKTWPCKPAVSWSDLADGLGTPCFGPAGSYFGSENEEFCCQVVLRFSSDPGVFLQLVTITSRADSFIPRYMYYYM